jgi:hypothetical protein
MIAPSGHLLPITIDFFKQYGFPFNFREGKYKKEKSKNNFRLKRYLFTQ